MRLWHEDLIPFLPRQQLLGQHRECCALRGKGWNKNHSTINYIFNYEFERLYLYHIKVMNEMKARGYKPNKVWSDIKYRGKQLGIQNDLTVKGLNVKDNIYPEHNKEYLQECLENLKIKGVNIDV